MFLYDSFFNLSDFWLFVLCVTGVGILTLLAALLMGSIQRLFSRAKGPSLVATMLTGILLPTGMVIAFVASDVWQNDEKGRVAVEQEATAISESLRVTRHLTAASAEPIRSLLGGYVRSVVDTEWSLMGRGQSNEAVSNYLETLMVEAVVLETRQPSTPTTILVGQELRKYVSRIELARDERLRIANTRVRTPKWVAVFIMLFVSACVLVELHMSSRRALIISMALFSLGFGVTVYLISAYDRPFTGKTIIEPTPLIEVMLRAY